VSANKPVSRDAKHYLVKRPREVMWKRLSWNQVQAELRERGTDADEAMLFRGVTTEDGTEYRDMYADSRTRVTEHADSGEEKRES
jgi:hypothetical protein